MNTNPKPQQSNNDAAAQKEKPFLSVIVHSFFIIPFLIAVFCVVLFAGIHLLTRENRTVYDYLEDIKTGGLTKRWQGAFELSKILANPKLLPKEDRFYNELIATFKKSRHDDNRVRQYLALAMGRTARPEFVQPLLDGLKAEKEENTAAIIYAVGMTREKSAAASLHNYISHPNARVRSITVVALGNIRNKKSIPYLKKALADNEANVRWGAALSLAHFGNNAGEDVLAQLLTRSYYKQFDAVDKKEVTNLILSTIDAAQNLNNNNLNLQIEKLASSDPNMKIRAKAMDYLKKLETDD